MVTCKSLIRHLKIRTLNNLLLGCILFYSSLFAIEQENLENANVVKKINLKELFIYDVNNELDREFIMVVGDSIKTVFWDGLDWFIYKSAKRSSSNNNVFELFSFNSNTKKIYRITNNNLEWIDGYSGTYKNIELYSNHLYLIAISKENDPIGHREILVINSKSGSVDKKIKLHKSSWIKKIYPENQNLIIEVQPMSRTLNIDYYLLFWAPRGRSAKWEYNPLNYYFKYIFDNSFNIISIDEVK